MKTCGEEIRQKNLATKSPKRIGENLRKQICGNLSEEVAKNGRINLRSQNSKAKIPHPKFPASPDGPFCVAEPPPPPKKPDPVPGT